MQPKTIGALLCLLMWHIVIGTASATELSCSVVRMIVPYAAGGPTDVAARLIAERLGPKIRQTVIVENRPGAIGNIGTEYVVRAPADGCTLLINAATMATFPSTFRNLTFKPMTDLIPVGGVGVTPTLLVTATPNKVSTLQDLITWSKEKSGGLTYATIGRGHLPHLVIEQLAQRTGGTFTNVPYRGAALYIPDLVSARVDFGSGIASSVLAALREGKLRALALAADKRSGIVPDVPTTAEQGFAHLDAGVHFLVFAPASTPKEIVNYLSDNLRTVIGDPAIASTFHNLAFDPSPIGANEAAAVMLKTEKEWTPIIQRLGIKMD